MRGEGVIGAVEVGVGEVEVLFYGFGGDVVGTGSPEGEEVVVGVEEVVGGEGGEVGGLYCGGEVVGVVDRGGEEAGARGDEGEEGIGVDGELGFAAGEEAEAGVVPLGEVAGHGFDGFGGLGFALEAGGGGAALAGGADEDQGDAGIEGGGDEGLFGVAGVAGESDLIGVDVGEGEAVVEGAAGGEGAAGELGEVVVGVGGDEGVGVVVVVGAVVDAGGVASGEGDEGPGALGVLGEEERMRGGRVREEEFEVEVGLGFWAEGQEDFAVGDVVFGGFGEGLGGEGLRGGGDGAPVPVFKEGEEVGALGGPVGGGGDVCAGGGEQGVGEGGRGGEGGEVGGEFVGGGLPAVEGWGGREEGLELGEVGLWGVGGEDWGDDREEDENEK